MHRVGILSAVFLIVFLPACGRRDGPVARRLRPLKELYVPIRTASLLSLDRALAEKGIGNVRGSDLKPQFQLWEWKRKEGNVLAIGVFTRQTDLPKNGAFMTMSPVQFLQAALADPDVQGVLFNPNTPKAWYITQGEARQALASLELPP
jgi:hypothetical protein